MKWRLIIGALIAAIAVSTAAPERIVAAPTSDAQLRAVVSAGFSAVSDQLETVLTCPECTDDAQKLERISGAYMRKVNTTQASTARGATARLNAFYAFKAYIVYGGDMALASLSRDNPSDVSFYHRLASTALKVAHA